jgi:hypothetical protein
MFIDVRTFNETWAVLVAVLVLVGALAFLGWVVWRSW